MNHYHSTRNTEMTASWHQAILDGIAMDGGLYVPSNIERYSIDLAALQGMSYQEIAKTILSIFANDFTQEEIESCVKGAYGSQFDDERITPLVQVGKHHVLELFHGPTDAFKDIALQILPHFTKIALSKEKEAKDILILTATSGDTGKAALEGFKDIEHTKIIVFYPKDGVSEIQKKQMITTTGNNTAVVALHGNFDDAQRAVKLAFSNKELIQKINQDNLQFSSANSINIGRLCPQIVYYFASYMQLVEKGSIRLGEQVNFVVPTGNFGNILAGYYAKMLGLPVFKLICASNENHILTDFFQTGIYDRNRNLEKTISPSMDILVSSNLERLLYHISGADKTADWMKELNETGRYQIEKETLEKLGEHFFSGYATDQECRQTIHQVYNRDGYVMDPHTSCASKVLEDYLKETNDPHQCIILSTASPYKFSENVYEALCKERKESEWQSMEALCQINNLPISQNLRDLKDLPVLHTTESFKEEVNDTILSLIKEKFL